MSYTLPFMVFVGLPWLIFGWVRIRRYARYFQLEGYDYLRYLDWLYSNPAEARYFWLPLGICLVLAIVTFAMVANPFLAVLISVGLSALTWYLAPKDREQKQKFVPTQRAVRLIIVASIIEALPLLPLGLFIQSLSSELASDSNSAEAKFAVGTAYAVFGLLFSGMVGPASYFLTPLTLPLANLINWPIEETFRRYYLRLAKQHLKRSGATVIAITGSYGKTSTKHYLTHILNARYRVLMTPKSYNTLLGISRVINDILANDASYDYFIVEAGAYIPGEIARICKLVEPQISMVVTVGPMHLERFGSIENVVKAKYEIVEALPPDGTTIFNADDPRVRSMAERGYPQNRILITRQDAPGARLAATNIRMTADGLDFDVCDNQTGEKRAMHAPLYGEHNVTNMLMAMGVARHLGMSLNEIAGRVATLEPAEHRLVRRIMPGGSILIDDAYSANPVGTQTALQVLALQATQPGARRIVVSSGMFELGPLHQEENRKLGERIAAVATDVILIGAAQTKPVQEGLHSANFPPDHLQVVNTLNEAVAIYRPLLRAGDALLILTDLPDTYA